MYQSKISSEKSTFSNAALILSRLHINLPLANSLKCPQGGYELMCYRYHLLSGGEIVKCRMIKAQNGREQWNNQNPQKSSLRCSSPDCSIDLMLFYRLFRACVTPLTSFLLILLMLKRSNFDSSSSRNNFQTKSASCSLVVLSYGVLTDCITIIFLSFQSATSWLRSPSTFSVHVFFFFFF